MSFDHKDDDVVIVDTHIHASCGPVTVDGPSPLFLLHGKRWQGYWGGTETDGIVGGCWGQGEAWVGLWRQRNLQRNERLAGLKRHVALLIECTFGGACTIAVKGWDASERVSGWGGWWSGMMGGNGGIEQGGDDEGYRMELLR